MTRRPALLLGLLTLAAVQAACMPVRAGDVPSAPPPLRYRRVLVPQEFLSQRTRGYLPIEREKFQTLLADIAERSRSVSSGAVWIESAEYHAVYADRQLVSGSAVLQITHAATEPAVLSLAPWGLAAGEGRWQSGETSSKATMGTDGAGDLLLWVPESGELHVPWTLRGTTNQWGDNRFDISLAAAPLSRIILDVPSDCEVRVDRGMIAPPTGAVGAPADSATPADLRRWVIELGGQSQCTLTVASRQLDERRQQLVNVQQDTTYRFTDDALEIACGIGLEIHREPLAELRLDIDAEVQVRAVRLGNVDVDWSSVRSDDGRGQTVRVQFAERLTGVHSTLQLSAVGPLHTDTNWRLPAFRPQGALWRQGTMSIVVPDTLELRHLTAADARQSAVATVPEGDGAEQAVFELFSADGALDVNVTRRPRGIVAEVGTTVDLDSAAVSTQMLADLRCRFGERFVVEAQVPNVADAWTIDGIDAEPADALYDYQVVAYEAEHLRLQIQLVRPLTTDKPLRLKIRAHRTPKFPLTADDVRPVEFLDTTYATRLVAVVPEANYRLDLEGDSALDRRDPRSLAGEDAGRIPPHTGGVVFVDDERARHLRMSLSREDPEFAAAVDVDAAVDQLSCVESYRIVCTPDSTPVSQLRVHLSQSRPADLAWKFVGDGNAVLGAQRVSGEQAASSLYRTGETWQIDLRRPQAASFEIRGQRTTRADETPTDDPLTVSLATLPAAVSHEGRLTIRSMDGTRFSVQTDSDAVKPIPSEPPPPGTCPTSRACYRFGASRTASVVIKREQPRGDGAALWVWNYRLTSQYLAAGDVIHVATFLLESAGGTELRVRLPEGCALRGLEINGLDASRAVGSIVDGSQSIWLPAGCRFPRVEVTYDEVGPPLGLRHRLTTEFPTVNVPVLDRRWHVWLPPGYRPAGTYHRGELPADEPPDWKQRLLGPLAAGSDAQPFRLFSRDDWSAAVGEADPERSGNGPEQAVLRSLGESLLATAADPRGEEITWRRLFQRFTDRSTDATAAPAIWVDASWLATEGFSLDHVLSARTGEDPIEAASALLSAAHLVIVVRGDDLFLTSRDGLARYPAMWETTTNSCTAVARPGGSLAQDLDSARDRAKPGIVPLATWIGTPAPPSPPWAGQRDWTRSGVTGRSWRICQLPVDETGRCALTVEHSKSLSIIGWSLLLAVAGIVGGWGRRFRRYMYPLLVIAAVLALVAPSGLVPITSCLCPGILLGIVIAGLRGRGEAREQASGAALADTLVARAHVVATVLCAVGLTLLQGGVLHAWQPQTGASGSVADTVYPVVVPVDAALVPVGQYDYVPLEFYDALHVRASQQGAARDEWFLRQATYRAIFNWRQQRSALDLTTMTAVYQLDVLRTHGRLDFPWDGQSGGVQLLEARLDGQPIELTWNAARSAFSIRVPVPGTFQLELVLRPETREEPGQRSLRFAVPPVAQAQLRVELPFGAPDVQAPSAVGSSYVDPESGTQCAELGPVKELLLRWPSGAAEDAAPQPMVVQQLMWLKVHPKRQSDAVMLEARFRVQAAARPVEEIKLRVDSRLRLLAEPGTPEYEWAEASAADPGDVLVTMRLRTPVERERTLHLRFHLTDTTGLGNVSLPRLECVNGRTTWRSLAVSVSPDIEFTAGTSELFRPLDAAEFLTQWGEAESAPNLCYQVLAEDPGWSLATRSRQPRSESRQTAELSIGRAGIQFRLDAEIETSNGEVYQHRLTVPREFRVSSVSVTTQETDVAKAVAHDGTGTVTVFLRRGVTGVHRLVLRGFQPLTDITAPLPLPQVALADAVVRSQTVRLYRQFDMWADVQTPPGLKLVAPTPEEVFNESCGRLVAAFELSEEGLSSVAGVIVRLRHNEPRFSTRLTTTLQRTGNQWEAIADFDALVASESGGCVDQFRFEIPQEWQEQERFSFETNVWHEVRAIPGQRPQLVVRPWSPVTDQFHLRMRFPLELEANERGRTPNIVPLDASTTERFFWLPTLLDGQKVRWETPGLVEARMEDVVREGAQAPTGQLPYRVWSKPRAVIADIQREARERRVSLADVFVDCQAGGSCYGVVTFAVEPAGTANCTLDVPAGCELVQASIDGVPAALRLLADRRWQVQLASEQLPQQLTVTFRSQLAQLGVNRTQTVAVPWVTELAVDRTLWTVRGPVGGTLQIVGGEPRAVSAAQQEARRLHVTASLVTRAAETVVDSPARDIQAWYTPWAVRLACAGARIAYARWSAPPDVSGVDPGAVAAVFREQQVIAKRLDASPAVLDIVHAQTSDVWNLSGHPAAGTSHYDFDGQVPLVPLSWRPDTRWSWWPGLLAVVAITALGIGFHMLERRGVLRDWWRRWPSVVGVLVGIGWWLAAWPSILGWAIVAVSLWGAIRLPAGAARVESRE